MAQGLYKYGRTSFALGDIKWKPRYGSTIKCVLTTRSYDPQLRSHKTLTDIPLDARIGIDGNHTKDFFPRLVLQHPEDGCCGAIDVVFDGVPPGHEIKHVVIYKEAPEEQDTILIACVSADFITNGTQIVIGWDQGPSKIFKL